MEQEERISDAGETQDASFFPNRRGIRLKGYDYSQAGAYFVTICTRNRAMLFGNVVKGQICLNDLEHLVALERKTLPDRFPTLELDAFVVMPNHIHGIIVITNVGKVVAGLVPARHNKQCEDSRATTRVAPILRERRRCVQISRGCGVHPTCQKSRMATPGYTGVAMKLLRAHYSE